jgi:hypothetical protein
MHIGEALNAAAVAEGEAGVVETHLVEDGGVDVVDADGIQDGVGSELIGLAIGGAAFESAASHEEAVAADVVVAPGGG